jgi:hypothetical protein
MVGLRLFLPESWTSDADRMVPRDSKVGRSATRRMAGLVGFRVGIAQS